MKASIKNTATRLVRLLGVLIAILGHDSHSIVNAQLRHSFPYPEKLRDYSWRLTADLYPGLYDIHVVGRQDVELPHPLWTEGYSRMYYFDVGRAGIGQLTIFNDSVPYWQERGALLVESLTDGLMDENGSFFLAYSLQQLEYTDFNARVYPKKPYIKCFVRTRSSLKLKLILNREGARNPQFVSVSGRGMFLLWEEPYKPVNEPSYSFIGRCLIAKVNEDHTIDSPRVIAEGTKFTASNGSGSEIHFAWVMNSTSKPGAYDLWYRKETGDSLSAPLLLASSIERTPLDHVTPVDFVFKVDQFDKAHCGFLTWQDSIQLFKIVHLDSSGLTTVFSSLIQNDVNNALLQFNRYGKSSLSWVGNSFVNPDLMFTTDLNQSIFSEIKRYPLRGYSWQPYLMYIYDYDKVMLLISDTDGIKVLPNANSTGNFQMLVSKGSIHRNAGNLSQKNISRNGMGQLWFVYSDGSLRIAEIEPEITSVYGRYEPSSTVEFKNPFPQPFMQGTNSLEIRIDFLDAQNISLDIYDIYGRHVSRLHEGYAQPGINSWQWDGVDIYGNEISTGIYTAILKTPSQVHSRKIVLMR